MATCDTCKHWMGNGTAYIAPCGLYDNNTASNHSCASWTPHSAPQPQPMGGYVPPIVACGCGAVRLSMVRCANCGSAS